MQVAGGRPLLQSGREGGLDEVVAQAHSACEVGCQCPCQHRMRNTPCCEHAHTHSSARTCTQMHHDVRRLAEGTEVARIHHALAHLPTTDPMTSAAHRSTSHCSAHSTIPRPPQTARTVDVFQYTAITTPPASQCGCSLRCGCSPRREVRPCVVRPCVVRPCAGRSWARGNAGTRCV